MISETLCDQTGFVLELLTPWFSLAWFPSYITCLYHDVTIFVKLTSTVAVFDWLIRLGNSPSAFRKIFAEGSFFMLCLPSSERCLISVAYLFFCNFSCRRSRKYGETFALAVSTTYQGTSTTWVRCFLS